jgi:hypothetical protein
MSAPLRTRYGGEGMGYDEHVACLKSLGDMSPEIDEDGGFLGFDAERTRPLADSGHAFNSYFKEEAAAVFAEHGNGRN